MTYNSDSTLPLAGIRIVDITSNISGPYGSAILADLGAEVLKIESPFGDPSRKMVPLDGDRSAYFHVVNRNKEVQVLNLKNADGILKLKELLNSADVFLSNFLPERLAKLNLSVDSLQKEFPKLIIGNLTSYGSIGKDASTPGYDATVQARTGIMHLTGEPGRSPVRTGISVLDMGAGMWLALGILAALVKRNETNKGSLVETSLYETGVTWVSYHLSAYQIDGKPTDRTGASHPTFSPYGLFTASDGEICFGVGSDEIFAKLANTIGKPELIHDPRFSTNKERVTNRALLNEELNAIIATKDAKTWVALLSKSGVPVDLVVPPENLFNDPQQEILNMLIEIPDKSSKVKVIPGIPLKFDGKRPQFRKAAPHLAK